MSANPKYFLTPADYLALERKSDVRHEYYNGEIFAMSGASRRHNLVTVNFTSELRQQLKGRRCETYSADMRVFIPSTGLYTYPDVVVVCGEPQFQDDEFDTLLNPLVIIETLSPATERYDRGQKFAAYRSINSLRHYVLASQDEYRIDYYTKEPDGRWWLRDARGLADSIELPAIECTLAMSEIYDKVTLSEPPR